MNHKMLKRGLPLLVLLLGAAIAWWLVATQPRPEQAAAEPPALLVETVPVRRTTERLTIEAQGTVVWVRACEVVHPFITDAKRSPISTPNMLVSWPWRHRPVRSVIQFLIDLCVKELRRPVSSLRTNACIVHPVGVTLWLYWCSPDSSQALTQKSTDCWCKS